MGSVCLMLGGTLGAVSVVAESLALLFLGSFSMGVGVGFGQFYRFAAIELASPENKGWAVTTVLMGGCVAAFFGPTLGLLTKDMFNAQYSGSFLMMVILGILNLGVVFVISFPSETELDGKSAQQDTEDSPITINPVALGVTTAVTTTVVTSTAQSGLSSGQDSHHSNGLSHQSAAALSNNSTVTQALSVSGEGYNAIFLSRTFANSTLVSAIAQIIMLIIMISSILKMSDLGFKLEDQALVLDFHFFAMFGTGFFTSYLLKNYNIYHVLLVAWALIGLAIIIFLSSKDLWAFFVGDFFVGVGWNIMFSTGTVMLSFCYAPYQRHHVQSVFEIIINTISGVFTIVSGFILSVYGWDRVVYGVLGIFCALSLVAPVYGQYYTDPATSFTEPKRISQTSDIECSPLDA